MDNTVQLFESAHVTEGFASGIGDSLVDVDRFDGHCYSLVSSAVEMLVRLINFSIRRASLLTSGELIIA